MYLIVFMLPVFMLLFELFWWREWCCQCGGKRGSSLVGNTSGIYFLLSLLFFFSFSFSLFFFL